MRLGLFFIMFILECYNANNTNKTKKYKNYRMSIFVYHSIFLFKIPMNICGAIHGNKHSDMCWYNLKIKIKGD